MPPRFAWITIRGWVIAFAIIAPAAIAYPLAVGGSAIARQPSLLLPWGFLLLALLGGYFLFVRSVMRLRCRVTEVGSLVCPRCGHDLRGVPEPGRCPECGREFTLEQLRESWRRFLRR